MDYVFSDRLATLGGNAIREIFKLLSDPEMISFAGGFPTLDILPTETVKSIVDELLMSKEGKEILQYGATEGYMPLRKLTTSYLSRYGIGGLGVDNVLIVSGGQQTIDLTCKAFVNKGDVVLVEDPTYLAVLHIIKSYEGKAVGLKSGDDGIDLVDLEEKIIKYKPKFLYLVPTFSNPTGRTISAEKRKKIAEITAKYNLVVLEDDPYSEIRYEGQRVPSIKSFDKVGNIIFTASFSKTIAPSLRTAICIGDPAVIRKLTIGKQATDVHTSTLNQAIVYRFLEKGLMEPRLAEIIPVYKQKKDAMLSAIVKYFPSEIKHTSPEGGLFIWCELPKNINASEFFADCAAKLKVAYVSGDSFFADERTKNCFRLNFSNASLAQIEYGIKKLGEYFTDIIAKAK